MIYLAQPYSHDDPNIRQERYETALFVCSLLLQTDRHVYSPIVHWHVVANKYQLPTNADFWINHNKHMISKSTDLFTLRIFGWQKSKGLYLELQYAQTIGRPVYVVDFDLSNRDKAINISAINVAALLQESVYGKDNTELGTDTNHSKGDAAR